MSLKIAILEDNAERQAAMQARLSDRFSQYESHFFAKASAMIDWLRTHLGETLAIGLDHDLEFFSEDPGVSTDPGTGRQVADYLSQQPPHCPVVIHSSNGPAADGMEMVLQDRGWTTYRIAPYEDLSWIPEWFLTLRRAIINSADPSDANYPLPDASRVLH